MFKKPMSHYYESSEKITHERLRRDVEESLPEETQNTCLLHIHVDHMFGTVNKLRFSKNSSALKNSINSLNFIEFFGFSKTFLELFYIFFCFPNFAEFSKKKNFLKIMEIQNIIRNSDETLGFLVSL